MVKRRNGLLMAGGGLLFLVALVGVFWYSHPISATAETPCGPNWSQSASPAEQKRCSQEKAVLWQQHLQQEQASFAATPHLQITPIPRPKVAQPASDKGIGAIPLQEAGGVNAWQGATSLWGVASVSNAQETAWSPFYVFTIGGYKGGSAALETLVLNTFTDDMNQYNHVWLCPRAIGTLTITAVTGPTGIVSFKSSAGQTGTFNLATQAWAFSP